MAEKWPGLKSVAKVVRTREIDDNISTEARYFISSLLPKAETIANGIRSHWQIENKLHWTLDTAFDDDLSRARVKNAAENFTVLRHITLNLLKKDKKSNTGIKGRRKKAG